MLIALALFPPAAGAATASVSITSTLAPRDLTVAVGTDVTWTNDDGDRHRMRTTSGPADFDSGNLDSGQSFTFTFDIEGTYLYMDDRNDDNSSYYGTVIVTSDGGGEPQPPPPPAPAGDVRIVDDTFTPGSITVDLGATVTWSNQDREHTVTARDRSWDSGIFDAGQTYSRTFDSAGTFEYFCVIHPDMVATVVVAGEGGAPPPPPPPPPLPPPPPPPAGASDVQIIDNDFDPAAKTVTVGSTVRWVNSGQLPHTVTTAGQFDSGILMSGDTWSRTFRTAGTYNYICTLHPEMTATIVVSSGGGEPPPPPGGEPPPPPGEEPPPPPPAPGAISIIDNDYQPGARTVAVGSTVRWVNNGQLPHTVTVGGQFDSGFLMNGDTWSRTFRTAGTYNYICTIHPEMTGTIIVSGAAGDDPPGGEPPPPPGEEPPPPPPAPGAISIIDNDYQPGARTVAVGSTVRWVNNGQLPHTVTVGGQFDSGFLMNGDTWSRTFRTAGTYNYICTIHPEMTGTIIVSGAAGGGSADGTDDGTTDAPTLDPSLDDTGTDATVPIPSTLAIAMIDSAFDPADIEVQVGDSVTWTNTGELPHTATARDESFDSGFLMAGDAWTLQFDEVGEFEYFCTIHPEMVGTITVLAATPEALNTETDASSDSSGLSEAAPDVSASQEPATAGVTNPTQASIVVILLIVLATVGFIVFLAHEVDFAPDSPDPS